MNIEVYCDESRQEHFARAGQDIGAFTLIGSLWVPTDKRKEYVEKIRCLRQEQNFLHEFKWTKITPKSEKFFLSLVKLFIEAEMRFRCVVLSVKELDDVKFCGGDKELMFYKFYYQVLHHWISDENSYRIYLDMKTNRVRSRLRVLKNCLSNSNLLAKIEFVQALPSEQVVLLQLADVLLGAVGSKYHGDSKSTAKLAVLQEIEKRKGSPIKATPLREEKFNVFEFHPGGGW